jgi:hypothetical protein
MFKKFINISFILLFFSFIFLIAEYYFSDKNKIFTSKLRSNYLFKINNNKDNLPLLENDTNNIIVYINDLENFKKKRKKRFWEKLISSNND